MTKTKPPLNISHLKINNSTTMSWTNTKTDNSDKNVLLLGSFFLLADFMIYSIFSKTD